MPYAKRTVLPGFPKAFVFEAREEIDAYLSGDRVTCLLCGHSYRILETHLRGVHGMSGDDYRERYGLPFQRGLCASDFSEQRVQHGQSLFANNRERQTAAIEKARAKQAETGTNPQRNKPYFWKRERTKYSRADFDEFARRVMSGRAAHQVETDDDMPSLGHVYHFMESAPDFALHWLKNVKPLMHPKSPGDRMLRSAFGTSSAAP